MKKEFLKVFKPKEGWIEIDKSLYSVYGLDKNSQAKVMNVFDNINIYIFYRFINETLNIS